MNFNKIIKLFWIVIIVLIISADSIAGNPGEWPDLRTNTGGDGPYNRGGYSPKGLDGVIRGDGTYMKAMPRNEYGWSTKEDNNDYGRAEEQDTQEAFDEKYEDNGLDSGLSGRQ